MIINKLFSLDKKGALKAGAVFQIALLVGMSFAIAFIFSGRVGVVGGQGIENAVSSANVYTQKTLILKEGMVPGYQGEAIGKTVTGITSTKDGSLLLKLGDEGTLSVAKTNVEAFTGAASKQGIEIGAIREPVIPKPGGGGTTGGFWGIFKGTAIGTGSTGAVVAGGLLSGAIWGGIVYGGMKLIGNLLGLEDGLTDALALGGFAGTFVGSSMYLIGSNGLASRTIAEGTAKFLTTWGPWIGIGVGAAIFVLTYKKEKKEIVKFECLPWEPPYGGNSCDKCNEYPGMPCSEYRCKSLGQACELVNGGTGEESCVWLHKDDVTAPKIEPLQEALSSGLIYTRESPGRFKIMDVDNYEGCHDPFTKFKFGVETKDELSKCRVDFKRTDKFEDMLYPLGNSQLFRRKHVQEIPVPNPFDEGGDVESEIHNNGVYTLFIRCVDANGNGQDAAEVAFSFCVNPGPDRKPPRVVGFSINPGSPVRFEVDEVPIQVYVNEPAECKWSHQDKDYEAMENEMNCAIESYQVNADLNYVCAGTLTGVKDREDNKFYFRCKDQPGKPEADRNVMRESEELLLKGSEPLVIDKVGPEGIIEGSTSTVMVNLTAETSHGAEEGKAICGYSQSEELSSFIDMDETESFSHSQEIPLTAGEYTFYFKCTDAGGNTIVADTTFTVKVDKSVPEITRVFRDGPQLKIILSEDVKGCRYSTTNCNFNFEEGEAMKWEGNKRFYYVDWSEDVTYYIKCEDLRGNQPSPNACQVIVQGSEF